MKHYRSSRRPLPFLSSLVLCALAVSLAPIAAQAQMEPTTPRGADEGQGPFDRLVIRGVTVIDGTGSPPRGPMDVVI